MADSQMTDASAADQIAALTAQLDALRLQQTQQAQAQTSATLAPTTPAPEPAAFNLEPTPEPSRPKRKLPDLSLFSGKRTEYLVWSITARQKIERDGPSIGTSDDQYAYLFARMETAAQTAVASYFQNGLLLNATPQDFLQYLDSVYLDPNAANRALDKLYNLRQKDSESFAVFLPRFERLLHEAHQNDQRSRMAILSRAISLDICNVPSNRVWYKAPKSGLCQR